MIVKTITFVAITFFLTAIAGVIHDEYLKKQLEYEEKRYTAKLNHIDELMERGANINEVIK